MIKMIMWMRLMNITIIRVNANFCSSSPILHYYCYRFKITLPDIHSLQSTPPINHHRISLPSTHHNDNICSLCSSFFHRLCDSTLTFVSSSPQPLSFLSLVAHQLFSNWLDFIVIVIIQTII